MLKLPTKNWLITDFEESDSIRINIKFLLNTEIK